MTNTTAMATIGENVPPGAVAAAQLVRLWNPPAAATPPAADDLDDEEDDDRCIGDGCDCPYCSHSHRVRTARCGHAECTAPTRYRLRAWRVDDTGQGRSGVTGRELGRTENPDERLLFDDGPIFMHGSERYACDKPHAYELAQQLRERYNRRDDADPRRWRVEIEHWRYAPEPLDLPHGSGLFWLQNSADICAYYIRAVVDAVNPHAVQPTRDARRALDDARRVVAQLVEGLAALDVRDIPQVRYTSSIPADVDTVTTAPAGQQPNYFNRRFPMTPTSGWSCMALGVVYESDDELLAAYPDGLYERPRSELILPNESEEVQD